MLMQLISAKQRLANLLTAYNTEHAATLPRSHTGIFLIVASAWLNIWSCSSVHLPACLPVPVSLLSKRPSSFCLIHFVGTSGAAEGQKRTFDGRRPLMEDALWWKTNFDGRRHLTEDNLWRKTTFDGRWPLIKDGLWWKTTFDGRWHLMEDDFWWKTPFDGIQLLTGDDLWRKRTFDGRRPLTEDDLWRKTTFDIRLPLTEDNL